MVYVTFCNNCSRAQIPARPAESNEKPGFERRAFLMPRTLKCAPALRKSGQALTGNCDCERNPNAVYEY